MASTEDEVLATLEAARGPMSTSEITKAGNRGESAVRDALGRLERASKVTSDRTGRITLWTFASTSRKEGRVPTKKAAETGPKKHYNGNPGNQKACSERDQKVLALLQKSATGLSKIQVAEKLDLPLQLAYNSLSRLLTAGEVSKERDGSRVPLWKAA